MDKWKRILFFTAGLIKTVAGGLMFLFSLLVLLLAKFVRSFFQMTNELVEKFVEELVASSDEYNYLLEYSGEQQLDYVMDILKAFMLVILVWAIIWIILGVFNFIFYKKGDNLNKYKAKSIALVVVTWLTTFINLSNILTTVAVFLKKKGKTIDKPNIQTYNI